MATIGIHGTDRCRHFNNTTSNGDHVLVDKSIYAFSAEDQRSLINVNNQEYESPYTNPLSIATSL